MGWAYLNINLLRFGDFVVAEVFHQWERLLVYRCLEGCLWFIEYRWSYCDGIILGAAIGEVNKKSNYDCKNCNEKTLVVVQQWKMKKCDEEFEWVKRRFPHKAPLYCTKTEVDEWFKMTIVVKLLIWWLWSPLIKEWNIYKINNSTLKSVS